MIVTLFADLFESTETDQLALLGLIDGGKHKYKVQLRPAYRPKGDRPFHRWLLRHGDDLQARIRTVFERGLKEKEFALEPVIEVRCAAQDEWSGESEREASRLSLATASQFLSRPLRLLLENGRNDWGFLKKIVPDHWRERWSRAVANGWLEQEVGGGIDELRRFIEHQLAQNEPRRLRTWAMFDSDADAPGNLSASAERTQKACKTWGVAYHLLKRRAIENYIPLKTLDEWVWRRPVTHREQARKSVQAYYRLEPQIRRFHNVKTQIDADIGAAIWGDGNAGVPYVSLATALTGENFDGERAEIFHSLFARL